MPNKKWKDNDKIFDHHMKVWDNIHRACLVNIIESLASMQVNDLIWNVLQVNDLIWNVLRDSIGLVEQSMEGIADEFK